MELVANGDNFISSNMIIKYSRVLVINDDRNTSRYITYLLSHLERNPYWPHSEKSLLEYEEFV